MLLYILKSTACLALFLFFYKWVLEKESMHHFKRFYLLGALVLSFLIPVIVFTENVYVEPSVDITTMSPTFIEAPLAISPISVAEPKTDYYLWIGISIYALGPIFFGFKFIKNLVDIKNTIRRNPSVKTHTIIHVLLATYIVPHTFFNYIFLNKKKYESHEIPKAVLLHEETHAKQKHSVDVLLLELVHVLFWFNPIIYGFKKAIKLNHEFLADGAVLQGGLTKSEYQNILLAFSSNAAEPQLANAINYSSIKKRFTVMKTKTSKKAIWLRSILVLPLFAILLVGFSSKQQIIKEVSSISSNENFTENPKTSEIEEFKIEILRTSNGLSIKCTNGCNWKELEFTIPDERKKLINKFGLIDSQNNTTINKENNGNFMFSIQKTEREILMKGLNGTAWTDLSFTLSKNRVQIINELGMLISFKENGLTQKQLNEYNTIAKKYNDISIDKRVIPLKDLNALETIYRKMSTSEKRDAQPFPECIPKNKQEGATKQQLATYNSLAKKYNDMDDYGMNIRQNEVEQLQYLYSKMSENQKRNAEPFPDFPEPPPAPKAPSVKQGEKSTIPPPPSPKVKKGEKSNIPQPPVPKEPQTTTKPFFNFPAPPRSPEAPKTLNTTTYASTQLEQIIEHQDPYDVNINIRTKPEPIPQVTNTFYANDSVRFQDLAADKNMRVYIYNSSSAKTNNSPNLMKNLQSLAEQGAQFYVDGKKITYKKGFEIIKNEKNIKIETLPYTNKQAEVRIYKNNDDVRIPPPPTPPLPVSPLDHVIHMAKEGAQFMYEGKEVSSDKAIDLIKNNKALNIETRTKNGKTIVKITKAPVTMD